MKLLENLIGNDRGPVRKKDVFSTNSPKIFRGQIFFIINVCVANIYGECNFGSPVVTQGLLGESCTVLEETEKWIRIQQSDNYEGWINKFYGVVSDAPYDSNRSCNDLGGGIYSDAHSKNPLREITFI